MRPPGALDRAARAADRPPLLPAWRLRRLGTARIRLADGRLLSGGDPPPAHLRLDVAHALARRPWPLRAAGTGAVLGTDPGWIWIVRLRPDGGVEPISLRRRPGRRG